ncbi:hypothetical protein EGJ55_02510 [Pseudomonas moraviensis]|nr:hypothetical protein DMX04_05870 [Pseudomonas koreensis]RRW58182.1 hypothetical protein EGJ55_02510 [Pseudomonas moraviensis]
MIQADSFLLHKKSKTPPKKTGFSPCLGGLRRSRTLSQLKKYTSHPPFAWVKPLWRGDLSPFGCAAAV